MKTMKRRPFSRSGASQAGAVLVTGLIFLAVLTILGVTSARMSTLEERMSGNMRDRALAMQAAELALRDAELDLSPVGCNVYASRRCIVGLSGFDDTCTAGLCRREGAALPTYTITTISWQAFSTNVGGFISNFPALTVDMTTAPSVRYGTFTGAPAIATLSAQPRYIIEGFSKQTGASSGTVPYYRITVRAQGANPGTVVWLQEVFTPP